VNKINVIFSKSIMVACGLHLLSFVLLLCHLATGPISMLFICQGNMRGNNMMKIKRTLVS